MGKNQVNSTAGHLKYVEEKLSSLLDEYGFSLTSEGVSGMGEWDLAFENGEFRLHVSHDRGGSEAIMVGAGARPRPRAPKRDYWIHQLRRFSEGKKDHFVFKNLDEQVAWLIENKEVIFNQTLLNSEELRKWSVSASRRQWSSGDKKR